MDRTGRERTRGHEDKEMDGTGRERTRGREDEGTDGTGREMTKGREDKGTDEIERESLGLIFKHEVGVKNNDPEGGGGRLCAQNRWARGGP